MDFCINSLKKVYISRYTVDPIKEVIKHEFTHTTEISKHYGKFQKYLFEESEAFKVWLKSKGYTKWPQMETDILKQYGKSYGHERAKSEIVAKFVSENLFKDSGTEVTESFLKELYLKDRNLFDRFVDWVKSVFARLKASGAVNKDIIKLEQKFIRLAETAKKQRIKDEVKQGKGQYSIVDTFKDINGNVYKNAVLLDTDFFDGLSPRNWGDKLKEYVENRAKNNPFIISIFDEKGNVQKLQFASTKDRVTKNGKSNHKVLDELSRTNDNLSKLSVIHIDEIASVSEENSPYFTDENNHQWLDENGWLHRNAYVIRKTDGAIFNLTFDIAKSRDGRVILFATKGKIKKVGSVDVNSLKKIKGTRQDSNFNSSIPNSSKNVKGQYSFAGENAKTANKLKLSTAKQMLKDGADSETIRKETGWFKGYDGKWRFEINDRNAKIDVKTMLKDLQIFINFNEARDRQKKGEIASDEYVKIATEFLDSDVSKRTLKDYFNHEKLFEAYPELNNISVDFKNLPVIGAAYNPIWNCIHIDARIINSDNMLRSFEKLFIHELQHAIQYIEGFTKGSSGVYWQEMAKRGNSPRYSDGTEMDPEDAYWNTAGEIEAYDASDRYLLDDYYRKEIRPDIDRKDVVFADGELKELVPFSENNAQYSIPSDHNYVYTNGKASFTEERLNNLFDEHSLGDGKRAEHSNAYVGYISPEDFVSLTSNKNIRSRVEDEAYVLNEEELRNETETPFIEYDPASGEVVGHEGRHRMVALKADGITRVAVLLKPSTDSFERRTVQDISLTGQNFAEGRASGNVTVKTAVPLSEKYREKAMQKFAKNSDADVRYSIPTVTPSPELKNAIDRLNNDEDVSNEELESIPQIRELLDEVAKRPETYTIDTPERRTVRKKVLKTLLSLGSAQVDSKGKIVYNGDIKQERRADIVIGLSAAGKSSVFVDPLSYTYSSRVIDSDMAKEELPEFDNGMGANAVHRESQDIIEDLLELATYKGDNIVWPVVGGNSVQSTIEKINYLKENGYSVYLHLNELSNNKAVGRSLNRYVETGRFIPPAIIKKYGDTPTQNFNKIINTEGLVDGYSHYSNDVARGEEPKLIEISENVREFDERRRELGEAQKEKRSSQKTTESKQVEADSNDGSVSSLPEKGRDQFSIPDIARGKTAPELWEMSQKGEITSDDALKVLAEQHGTMPKGENPKVDVTLPEQISKTKNVNQFMRNVLESGHLDADMSETEKRNIISGARTYKPISDKAALSRAERALA